MSVSLQLVWLLWDLLLDLGSEPLGLLAEHCLVVARLVRINGAHCPDGSPRLIMQL